MFIILNIVLYIAPTPMLSQNVPDVNRRKGRGAPANRRSAANGAAGFAS